MHESTAGSTHAMVLPPPLAMNPVRATVQCLARPPPLGPDKTHENHENPNRGLGSTSIMGFPNVADNDALDALHLLTIAVALARAGGSGAGGARRASAVIPRPGAKRAPGRRRGLLRGSLYYARASCHGGGRATAPGRLGRSHCL